MIIAARKELPHVIGETYRDRWVRDYQGVKHNIPFTVLRQATYEEWLAEYESEREHIGGPLTPAEKAEAKQIGHFYQISID